MDERADALALDELGEEALRVGRAAEVRLAAGGDAADHALAELEARPRDVVREADGGDDAQLLRRRLEPREVALGRAGQDERLLDRRPVDGLGLQQAAHFEGGAVEHLLLARLAGALE